MQRLPKSTGFLLSNAFLTNSSIGIFNDLANVSIKEPHPEEQASFNKIVSTAPSFILIYFISWPPISIILVTFDSKKDAAVK